MSPAQIRRCGNGKKTIEARSEPVGGESCQGEKASDQSGQEGQGGGESCPDGQATGGGSCQGADGEEGGVGAKGLEAVKENMKRVAAKKGRRSSVLPCSAILPRDVEAKSTVNIRGWFLARRHTASPFAIR